MTEICMIAGVARNGTIGLNGGIPWRLSEDFKFFKRMTVGYPTIMGRKTYESIGKALPDRPAIVVSKQDRDYLDAVVIQDPDSALDYAIDLYDPEKVFIIGGEGLYKHLLDKTDILYLTIIDQDFEGDTVFPSVRNGVFEHPDWLLVDSVPCKGIDPVYGELSFSFNTYHPR